MAVHSLGFEMLRTATGCSEGFSAASTASRQVRARLSRSGEAAPRGLRDAEKTKLASVCKDTSVGGPGRESLFYGAYGLARARRNTSLTAAVARTARAHLRARRGPPKARPARRLREETPQRRAQATRKMFAPAGPEPIVAIKAGKCKVEPHRDEAKRAAGKLWITPQKDRGEVIVVKKDDVNHFQWRSREMPCAVDPNIDTMVFPGADPA